MKVWGGDVNNSEQKVVLSLSLRTEVSPVPTSLQPFQAGEMHTSYKDESQIQFWVLSSYITAYSPGHSRVVVDCFWVAFEALLLHRLSAVPLFRGNLCFLQDPLEMSNGIFVVMIQGRETFYWCVNIQSHGCCLRGKCPGENHGKVIWSQVISVV